MGRFPQILKSLHGLPMGGEYLLLAFSDDEIRLKEIGCVDPDQGDRVGARKMDHGIPRNNIIADHRLQGGPGAKAVRVHIDDVVLRRRAADSRIAPVEVVYRVVAGTDAKHEAVVIGSAEKQIITGPAI
jgi:hypothetical protein